MDKVQRKKIMSILVTLSVLPFVYKWWFGNAGLGLDPQGSGSEWSALLWASLALRM